MTDFQTFINEERSRLTKLKAELEAQITDLRTQIGGIDRELTAIAAYEKAKTGAPATAPTGKRGSRKDTVLGIIKENKGIEPKRIIELLGPGVPKGGVHNLLGTLKKQGAITVEDGKYHIA